MTGKIALTLCQSTLQKIKKELPKALKKADLVELRLDYLTSPSKQPLQKFLSSLKTKVKNKLILTCRTKRDGGKSTLPEKKRLNLLKTAITHNVGYIDIEHFLSQKTIEDIKHKKFQSHSTTKIILSYHNFKQTPNLNPIYKKLKEKNPDIIKIVPFAKTVADNKKVETLLTSLNKKNSKKTSSPPIISFCMGECGQISRVLALSHGSFLTFACLDTQAAPGQIHIDTLKKIYKPNRKHPPKLHGLIGNPVSESKGYIIHNTSFHKTKLNNIYLNFHLETLLPFIKTYKSDMHGFSVTMPFKQAIIKHLDRLTKEAKDMGSVNTVVVKNRKWLGYNTDYIGVQNALKSKTTIKNKQVVMLGAGGVARAAAYAITKEGGNLTVTDLDLKKAKQLAKEFDCTYCTVDKVHYLPIDILINATPVGMYPNVKKTPFSKKHLAKHMVVFDAIYNPLKTQLIKDAEKKGCKTILGIDLFIAQAAAQFKLWTGKAPSSTTMRKVVLEALK